jgi:CheY-like chemotaxis protein
MGTTVGPQFRKSGYPPVSAEGPYDGSEFHSSGLTPLGHFEFGRQPLVLVADDEALVRQLICSLLARRGWRTVEASDGVEALGLSIDEKVDLLITDYEMPSISGLQLANAVRRRTPDVPILMISGYPACVVVARDHGFHFLHRPFEPDELMLQVETIFEELAGGSGIRSTGQTNARRAGVTAR